MTTTIPTTTPLIWLASRSPRRRELLAGAGYRFEVVDAGVDDGLLEAGPVDPEQWAIALAFLKAASAAEDLQSDGRTGVILGADTLCVMDEQIIGQPRDRDHAGRILRSFVGRSHDVITGVALVCPRTERRALLCDRATVRWGSISEDQIEVYLGSDQWAGKAGAYNLTERLDAGWVIDYTGDPGTIVGLPMRRLAEELERFNRPFPAR